MKLKFTLLCACLIILLACSSSSSPDITPPDDNGNQQSDTWILRLDYPGSSNPDASPITPRNILESNQDALFIAGTLTYNHAPGKAGSYSAQTSLHTVTRNAGHSSVELPDNHVPLSVSMTSGGSILESGRTVDNLNNRGFTQFVSGSGAVSNQHFWDNVLASAGASVQAAEGYVVSGISFSEEPNGGRPLVLLLDSGFQIEHTLSLDETFIYGDDSWTYRYGSVSDIAVDSSENLFLLVSTIYDSGAASDFNADTNGGFSIIQITESGERVSVSHFIPQEIGVHLDPSQLFLKDDGSFLVSYVRAYHERAGDGSSSVTRTVRVAQFDSSGDEIWQYADAGPIYIGMISVDVLADDSILMALNRDTGQSVDGRPLSDSVLVKLDSSGNVLWQRQHDFGSRDYPRTIRSFSDGSIYVSGYCSQFDINTELSSETKTIYVARLNAEGQCPDCD